MGETVTVGKPPVKPTLEELDNPIWASLTTGHASMAFISEQARRYPREASPLAALREPTESAFAALSPLVSVEETVAFFTASMIEIPLDWEVDRERWIDQMIFQGPAPDAEIFKILGVDDVPDMLELTAATEPGPFRVQTIEMGRYIGIRSPEGVLAAMAGERLKSDAFTEVSAVCTHPDFRGRGYAGGLVAALCKRICDHGRTPILHVMPENPAKGLYEKLGFRFRHEMRLSVLRPKK